MLNVRYGNVAKNLFDQFSKLLLEEVLSPFGSVETSCEVSGEAQFVDVYFEPSPSPTLAARELGLSGKIAQTPCLLEPFRNQPTPAEVRSCLLKLYQVHGDYQRKARREQESIAEEALPQLWILASSASDALLSRFGATHNDEWGAGVYFLAIGLKVAIIAINQLPLTEETIWLRLLGRGQTQKQAVTEVIAFDTRDPRRSTILRLLANWKISIELTDRVEAEEELMMALSQAYLEWEQQTEQKGRAEGEQVGEARLIMRQLTRRLGQVAPEIEAQVRALSLPQLEALGEALLDFSGPNDLVDWLRLN
ncbi:DUF4351 domain-containing protein [Altericista sp. CCNU0014]|uniref:DUF4351 domain-containing protein n=1 Tax=Altericista sp. CCNU0014 TaxID=3082949 RepID=UPI00385102D3